MAIVFDVVLTNVSGAVRMWRQSGLQPRQESLPAGQVFSLQVMSKGSSVSAQEIFGWSNRVIIEWISLYNAPFSSSYRNKSHANQLV